jgi:hypothetical protein
MADKKADDPEPIDVILLNPREEVVMRACGAIAGVLLAVMLVAAILALTSTPTTEDAVFTMGLVSFSGLNATVGPTVSPAFTLNLHVENPFILQPWCSNGGEVVVSYSGVALAWCNAPAFCVRRRSASELTVLPWGWEVGLSEDLRRRLLSEWRNGTAQVSVEMMLFSPDCWMPSETCGSETLYRFRPFSLS